MSRPGGQIDTHAPSGWSAGARATSLVRLLEACASAGPDDVFLDFSGSVHTYADTWTAARELAGGLERLGVAPGHTVVSMLDNSFDAVALWFATNLLGAIWVPVNTALRGEFLRHVVHDTGAAVAVCEPDFVERIVPLAPQVPTLAAILVRGTAPAPPSGSRVPVEPLDSLRHGAPGRRSHFGTADDLALLVYTGGTTGPSKGCAISHGYALNLGARFLEQTGRTEDELNWSPLPIYHFNLVGQTIAGTLLLQGTASVAPRFSVSGFWPEMERTGARVVNLLGSMGSLIAQMDDVPQMARCFGQIRVLHGAPFPREVARVWEERFGVERVGGSAYGLTEAVPLTTLHHLEVPPPGSSGRRNDADFDVRIFGEGDRELATGQVGEVVARPRRPNVMFAGYWRRPEATVEVTSNLWFHTGDLGRFDADGFFYFVDRKKDCLRRRGENISSQELEAAILEHPDLEQVAVHAVPSELTEDDIKVTAVLRPFARLRAPELFEWSKDRVPYFALPRYIEFRAALPVSPLGRVLKHQLRDEGCTEGTWDREAADVSWERR